MQTPGSAAGESGKQKEKIKLVMDFTGRSEEDVYTALFDAVSDSFFKNVLLFSVLHELLS